MVLAIKVLLGISLLCQLHFTLNIVLEVSTALNIRIFKVKEKVMEPEVPATDDFERAMEVKDMVMEAMEEEMWIWKNQIIIRELENRI